MRCSVLLFVQACLSEYNWYIRYRCIITLTGYPSTYYYNNNHKTLDRLTEELLEYLVIILGYFSYSFLKTHVVGTHQKCLNEVFLMSTHLFSLRNKKNYPKLITKYPSLTNISSADRSKGKQQCQRSGPSCSKLTMSLVNDSLKFTWSDMQIC